MADLSAGVLVFFFFFGKGEQVWKQLFPLLEASPKCNGADGAARCLLCTDITNRQTPPYIQDNRKAVTICIAHTLEQTWGCPMQLHSRIFSSLAHGFAMLVAGPLPEEQALPRPTWDNLEQRWQ